MASITFRGTEQSDTSSHHLEVLCNENNEIFLQIDGGEGYIGWICLDIDTSVQFSKYLRKAIAIAKQNADSNE